jgi:CheY-like chemotaxis protein
VFSGALASDGKGASSVATILIVDDERQLRELLELFLAGLGYQTLQASNGLHALRLGREMRPDLVLTDIKMPVMDGIELTNRLRNGETDWPNVPVVHMSSSAPRAESHAADAFLAKPFDFDQVQATLERLLS